MKTLRENKKMITLLVIVLICVLGTIIVGIFSNDKVNASGSIPVCSICTTSANMQYTGATDSGHTYVCSVHGQSKTEAHAYSNGVCTLCGYEHTHTYGSWQEYDDSKHIRYCTGCGQGKTESHIYSEGRCTACGYEHETHTYSTPTCTEPATCSICGYQTGSALGHDMSYVPTTTDTHQGKCIRCEKYIISEWHSFVYTDNLNGTCTGKCTLCHFEYNFRMARLCKWKMY
ncbi:MAG: hypothetical protein ACI4U9_02375 [Clostridia bacterium]